MTKKELFVKEISELIEKEKEKNGKSPLSEDSLVFFEALKISEDKAKSAITDKGKDIILYIQNNYSTFNNMFSSKQIAEGMGVPTKSVSASMRGLVSGGYLEKISDKPVIYSITDKGKEYSDVDTEA